jgi:hypothetical protein
VTRKDIFCQEYFEKNLWESAEIARVYAGFSPVRPASLMEEFSR